MIIINVEISRAAHIFVETVIYFIFHDSQKTKERVYFKYNYFVT